MPGSACSSLIWHNGTPHDLRCLATAYLCSLSTNDLTYPFLHSEYPLTHHECWENDEHLRFQRPHRLLGNTRYHKIRFHNTQIAGRQDHPNICSLIMRMCIFFLAIRHRFSWTALQKKGRKDKPGRSAAELLTRACIIKDAGTPDFHTYIMRQTLEFSRAFQSFHLTHVAH